VWNAFCSRKTANSWFHLEHEEEQFEDDPLEYIRRDLSLSMEGACSTRRHAASELVRALMSVGLEAKVTHIVQSFVREALRSYASNPTQNWKDKDTAIYLFSSVASLGSTASQGVTNTSLHVDVIKFFLENVYGDLQNPGQSAHPILQVDAIRFIYQFRYQVSFPVGITVDTLTPQVKLTKDQHLAVLPNLIRHLASSNYVLSTYAAITIERTLFITKGGSMLWAF
jgi:exportin-2 (importin alpha re-exporter)